MIIKFKRTQEGAVCPRKTFDEDFAFDVVATSCEKLSETTYKYGIGLAFEIDECERPQILIRNKNDNVAKFDELIPAIDLRPRSSICKHGMILSNCIGTIDQLYRGEVSAVFYHIDKSLPRYEVGDKIGQILLSVTLPIAFVETDALTPTQRGEGGYGSTGR